MNQYSHKVKELATLRKLRTGQEFREMAKEIRISSTTFTSLMNGRVEKPQALVAEALYNFFINDRTSKGEQLTRKDLGYED